MEIQVIEIRQDRPADIPDGWRVFNAPRPLYGQMDWQGDFLSGIFYVAVDPASEISAGFIERNRQLDARELVYISQEEFDARVDAYGQKMANEYGIDLDDFDRKDVIHSYQDWKRQSGQDVRW